MNIRSIRREFPIVNNKIFLNHAGVSPYPKPVLESIRRYIEELSRHGVSSIDLNEGKELFAKLIDAKPEEIAFVPNTSTGLNIVANVLEYPSGANVVVTDMEYPSVVYPWLRKKLNVKVRYVKNVEGTVSLRDIKECVDDKTVAVSISHVEYANGFRHDLKSVAEIAHKHGAYLIVDAIQSLGAIRVDVKRDDIDFLSASCYKWLLSPAGAGFLYVRKELVEELEPPFVGWSSVKPEVFETVNLWDNRELRLSETASRFEVGQPSVISIVGVIAALRLILSIGVEEIERRVLDLTGYLIEEIKCLGLRLQTPEENEFRSGIVNFLIEDPEEIVRQMSNEGIIVSARANGVRVSPHFYNTKDEIDTFIDHLKCFKKVEDG